MSTHGRRKNGETHNGEKRVKNALDAGSGRPAPEQLQRQDQPGAEPCTTCGQSGDPRTGEHPCKECGRPRTWDDRAAHDAKALCENCNDTGRVGTEVPGRAASLISYCAKGCPAALKAVEDDRAAASELAAAHGLPLGPDPAPPTATADGPGQDVPIVSPVWIDPRDSRALEVQGFLGHDALLELVEPLGAALAAVQVDLRRVDAPPPYDAAAVERAAAHAARSQVPVLFVAAPERWSLQRARRAYGIAEPRASSVPSVWRMGLPRVAEIWAPSPWAADVLRSAGARHVEVIAPGLRVQVPAVIERDPRPRGEKLRILVHAETADDPRAGVDLAIAAFLTAFPRRRDVELHVVSRNAFLLDRPDPRVTVGRVALDASSAEAFYRGFDAVLYPARCDAFGRIPLEALAAGVPAIVPRSSGMLEFVDDALDVRVREVPARDPASPPDARWYEPLVEDLVLALHELDESFDALEAAAAAQARAIADRFSWGRTAERVRARLDA